MGQTVSQTHILTTFIYLLPPTSVVRRHKTAQNYHHSLEKSHGMFEDVASRQHWNSDKR